MRCGTEPVAESVSDESVTRSQSHLSAFDLMFSNLSYPVRDSSTANFFEP